MGTTPIAGLPFPELTDIPDIPQDIEDLANAVDTVSIPRFATTTARDAAITAPVAGQECWVTDWGFTYYNGTAWIAKPLKIIKTTDQTINNTTTLVSDTQLVVPVVANGSYIFTASICYIGNAAADYKFTWTNSATWGAVQYEYHGVDAAGASIHSWFHHTANDSTPGNIGLITNTEMSSFLNGRIIIGGSGGSVTWRWAQNGAHASNLVTRAGSYIETVRYG
jgi:hypothetical protein